MIAKPLCNTHTETHAHQHMSGPNTGRLPPAHTITIALT